MRRGWLAGMLVLALAGAAEGVVLNFDELTATGAYSQGVAVPANARLSTQYLASSGIRFASGSAYVAVGNYGSAAATSGSNGIAGTSAGGAFDYAAPVTFSFWDPANPAAPATTNFFSVRGDRDPTGGGVQVTVSAFDLNGALLGSNTQTDSGGETWTLSLAGIHSVVFPGTSANPSFGGIALDDVTFNPVTVPEPGAGAATLLLCAGILGTLRRMERPPSQVRESITFKLSLSA
jgi:hypothetical protein